MAQVIRGGGCFRVRHETQGAPRNTRCATKLEVRHEQNVCHERADATSRCCRSWRRLFLVAQVIRGGGCSRVGRETQGAPRNITCATTARIPRVVAASGGAGCLSWHGLFVVARVVRRAARPTVCHDSLGCAPAPRPPRPRPRPRAPPAPAASCPGSAVGRDFPEVRGLLMLTPSRSGSPAGHRATGRSAMRNQHRTGDIPLPALGPARRRSAHGVLRTEPARRVNHHAVVPRASHPALAFRPGHPSAPPRPGHPSVPPRAGHPSVMRRAGHPSVMRRAGHPSVMPRAGHPSAARRPGRPSRVVRARHPSLVRGRR